MKENFLRVVLAGLFALSVGTAGAVFAQGPLTVPVKCPSCSQDLACPGSPCNCKYNTLGNPPGYVCVPPAPP